MGQQCASCASQAITGAVCRSLPLDTGESFYDSYELGTWIGEGSDAKVYACVHRKTGEQNVVKVLDAGSVKTAWRTFHREVELCKLSRASHVVKVLADFVHSDKCFIVMERFACNLRTCTASCPRLDDQALRNFARQGLSAIAYLHEQFIVHRDVKTTNFFVDRLDLCSDDFRMVLGDLGLAKRLVPGKYFHSQVGNSKYWGPEIYNRRSFHAVDVFALGVTFFLLVTCRYPFKDISHTLCYDVADDLPERLSLKGKEFLLHLLMKDPYVRATAAEAQCHAWLWGEQHEVVLNTKASLDDGFPDRLPPSSLSEAIDFRDHGGQVFAGAYSPASEVSAFAGAYSPASEVSACEESVAEEVGCHRDSRARACCSYVPTQPVLHERRSSVKYGKSPQHAKSVEAKPVVQIMLSEHNVSQRPTIRFICVPGIQHGHSDPGDLSTSESE